MAPPLFLAAIRVTARRGLDGPVLPMNTNPFDPAACRDTGCYVVGLGVLAAAADRTGSATTVRGQ